MAPKSVAKNNPLARGMSMMEDDTIELASIDSEESGGFTKHEEAMFRYAQIEVYEVKKVNRTVKNPTVGIRVGPFHYRSPPVQFKPSEHGPDCPFGVKFMFPYNREKHIRVGFTKFFACFLTLGLTIKTVIK
eukprot:Trichotokara_eunicae@DN1827_c0_g1_i2.p1